MHWIITGPKNTLDTKCKKAIEVNKSVSVISQITMNSLKTQRQMNHSSNNASFRQMIETPFTVGLGLHVHKTTRSKALVNMLSEFNLSISYEKVMKLENLIAASVVVDMEKNNGVHIPPNISQNKKMHFAIDNLDFRNETPDGKHEFHGTTTVTFQKNETSKSPTLPIDRSKSEKKI